MTYTLYITSWAARFRDGSDSGAEHYYGRIRFAISECVELHIKDCCTGGCVEEWTLDGEVGKIKRTMWRCYMPGGQCNTTEVIDLPSLRVPDKFIEEFYNYGIKDSFIAYSYVSESHGRKLAIEEYQRRLREKA